MSRRTLILILALLVAAGLVWHFRRGGPKTYDPAQMNAQRIAAAEARMWQAYYGGSPEGMGHEIILLMTQEFDVSHKDAILIARDLGTAAFTFKGLSGDYEEHVLDDLVSAYTRIHDITGGEWEPRDAARAELTWWVDRRIPGRSGVEHVGRSIARLYTILSGKDSDEIQRADYLRAKSAQVRDQGGDWLEVQRLLEESYGALARGLEK